MANGYLTPWRGSSLTGSNFGSGLGSSLASGYAGGSLFDLHRQMNRLFDDLFNQSGDSGSYARAGMAVLTYDQAGEANAARRGNPARASTTG